MENFANLNWVVTLLQVIREIFFFKLDGRIQDSEA
jgi:hypothetical protein